MSRTETALRKGKESINKKLVQELKDVRVANKGSLLARQEQETLLLRKKLATKEKEFETELTRQRAVFQARSKNEELKHNRVVEKLSNEVLVPLYVCAFSPLCPQRRKAFMCTHVNTLPFVSTHFNLLTHAHTSLQR